MEIKLNDFAREIHQNAKDHGWWDEPRSFGDIIALCHSELSEALEEYRGDKPMVYRECDGHVCDISDCTDCDCINERHDKPEGVAVEMIDCLIRILDWCGRENIDVGALLRLKHEYNKTRPYKHGGKVM